ncbi:MAG: hypothetical protein NTV73_05885 [Hyphomicrobiales bacterium]|nr:hypothetical protein [Hyphomicrobiales bacterium]
MHGNSTKTAATVLSALLCTQGFLCAASVTVVMLRDHLHAKPAIVSVSSTPDARRVN